MSPNAYDILQSALALPDADQLKLAAALNAAIEERGLRPFDDAAGRDSASIGRI